MSKQNAQPADEQLLTAEDIFSGGDDLLTPLEIPELPKNGKPGVVYLKQLSAGDVLDFAESDKETKRSAVISLIAKAIVNPDGSPMFDDELQIDNLRNIRADVFTRLSRAVTESINVIAEGVEGKGDGKDTDDLPIV